MIEVQIENRVRESYCHCHCEDRGADEGGVKYFVDWERAKILRVQ